MSEVYLNNSAKTYWRFFKRKKKKKKGRNSESVYDNKIAKNIEHKDGFQIDVLYKQLNKSTI